jgi:hypothetical protein
MDVIRLAIAALALALTGCAQLQKYGIGGEPVLMCDREKTAHIDDRIAGPDQARLSLVRRFKDGDPLCK